MAEQEPPGGALMTVSAWRDPVFGRTCQIVVGVIFILASIGKIADPVAFASDIGNHQILPIALELPLALILPQVELLCGLGLVTSIIIRGAALGTALMLLLFMGVLVTSMARGLAVDCGCFGGESGGLEQQLALDLLLSALLLRGSWPLASQSKRTALPS